MRMTHQSPAREPLLELYDALAQRQLRDAGAEVAAAIAHAVGTPLNVISGRAELIRHDPSNALAQVARIEEQVKKLATGLRQLVDYLAVPDPRAQQQIASTGHRSSSAGAAAAREAAAARQPRAEAAAAAGAAPEFTIVDVKAVLDDVVALTKALAQASDVDVVVDASGLAAARVERWHALGMLATLLSGAIRYCSEPRGAEQTGGAAQVRVGGSIASNGVVFELVVPGLELVEGWHLEHFEARPAAAACPEFYRTLSICAAVARGHGGKLQLERAADAGGLVVRFSCINEASP